jgi:hypothetical protein
MTTERSVGAASHASLHWRDIDSRSVNRNVRRLQVRIVKAVEAGRLGKMKALQRLLTHSRDGKRLAVRRVTEDQGRKTSGVDGIIWENTGKECGCCTCAKRQSLTATATPARINPEVERQITPTRYPHHEGQRDAGVVPADTRSRGRDYRGRKLLRVPQTALLRGCDRRLLCSPQTSQSALGVGRRYPRLLRQH